MGINAFGQSIISSVVATAGESVEEGSLNVSWTLGELAVGTLDESGTIILTQGFQQGYFEITSIGEPLSNNFKLNVYPNPAINHVWVSLESEEIQEAVVEFYDLDGKMVYVKRINDLSEPNMIMLDKLSSSQYILRISDSAGRVLQTYKLIKR